jgi:formylglycine-generating enzyme required for sulfatase activity
MGQLAACRTFAFFVVPVLAAIAAEQPAKAPSAPQPATRAVELKTQKVTFKLVRDDMYVKGLDRTIELVQIPAGTIILKGPDAKDHEHAIKPIWMAKYETRWDEYNVFWMGLDMTHEQWRALGELDNPRRGGPGERPETPYMPYEDGGGKDLLIFSYPASCIHFRAAMKYCAWLSKLTGHRFRLPTEAEWEYACRAGGPPLAPDAKALDAVAWFEGNSGDHTHPVGKKRSNAWGLYDMLGNVGEYVIRDQKDDNGLLAGGSYYNEAKDVHSGAREQYSPAWHGSDPQDPVSTRWLEYGPHRFGFRVVMEE